MQERETEDQRAVGVAEHLLNHRSEIIGCLPEPPAGFLRPFPYRVPPHGANPAWGWIPVDELADCDREQLNHANGLLHLTTDELPINRFAAGDTLSVAALRELQRDYTASVSNWHWDEVPPVVSLSVVYGYVEGVTLPVLARSRDKQLNGRERDITTLLLDYQLGLLQTIGAAIDLDHGMGSDLREDVRYFDEEARDADQRATAAEFVDFLAALVETPDRTGIRELPGPEVGERFSWWARRYAEAGNPVVLDLGVEEILGAACRKVLELEQLQRRSVGDVAFPIAVYQAVRRGVAASTER